MRRFFGLAAFALLASAAQAQDTTVVIVRHLPEARDTGVVVRRLAPPPQQRFAPPMAQRYGARSTAIFAKDPSMGTMLSFVFPGGGQYYAGNQGKGLAITLLAIGAPIVGYASVDHQRNSVIETPNGERSSCDVFGPGGGCRRTDWTPAAIGLGVGITSWLYGIATAGSDVQHWNQAHGVRFVSAPGRVGFAVALP